MDEFNLDFLKTPPKHDDNKRFGSPFVFNEFDVRFGKKCSRRFGLATKIAKVDELVQEIERLKSKNLELQQQLKGFQATAQQVQELYIKEKNGHSIAKLDLGKLQKEHSEIDETMANMTLENEQLKARLDEYNGRPISFENLVVKYVKVMTKFQGNDILKNSQDKDLVERLREYCRVMKYKVPRAISPKKPRPAGSKPQTREAFVQCQLLAEIAECVACKSNANLQNQNTQFPDTKRDQASQYISTMVTRQTNTDNIVQKHVQTMFPELPAVDDILKVYAKWSNIRSVSPLLDSPPRSGPSKELFKSQSTTGTCTMLCNIRRKIDYLPANSPSNIKQEFFTPSASPTPITDATITNGSRANSLFSVFNSSKTSSLDQLSFNAFNELWQIFGKMLLSLLQNSNTGGVANTNPSSQINQQQFLDWLIELYTNAKANSATPEPMPTQTLEQKGTSNSKSPLIFNGTSVLSAHILRPQPQKTLPVKNSDRRNTHIEETKADSRPNLIDCSSNNPSVASLESSIRNKIRLQQITSKTNEIHANNICASNRQHKSNSKSHQNEKSKHKILDEIQDLLPGIRLTRKKRRHLKRLLKSHRKKSYEIRKNNTPKVGNKSPPVVINTNRDNGGNATETESDFLKSFVGPEQNSQPTETNSSETEKMFSKKQVSNDQIVENAASRVVATSLSVANSNNSLTQPSATTNGKSKCYQRIVNKYQLLFGNSDDEEMESVEFRTKPVIKSNVGLESSRSKCDNRTCAQQIDETAESDQENYKQLTCAQSPLKANSDTSSHVNAVNMPLEAIITTESTFDNDNSEQNQNINRKISESWFNPGCHDTLRNGLQSSLFVSDNPVNSSQEITIPDIPASVLKDLEYNYFPDVMKLADADFICPDTNLENLNPSLVINSTSFANFENSLANDLDVGCVKRISEISETEAKVEQTRSTPFVQERSVQASCDLWPRLNEEECSNASMMASQPIIINSSRMYSSDFEKDFELSSDNESLIESENYSKQAPKAIAGANKQTTGNLNSFGKELKTSKEDSNILLAKPTNWKPTNDDKQKTNDSFSIEMSDGGEFHNILQPPCEEAAFEKKRTSAETYEANENNIMHHQEKVVPVKDNAHISLPNQKEDLETCPTNCLLKSIAECKTPTKTPMQSGKFKTIKRCGENNEEQNTGNGDGNETKENSKEMSNTSSITFDQSQSDVAGTPLNPSTCSIITISDASSREEISATTNKENDQKDLHKLSRLGSLKLLHLNTTLGLQKPCNNSKECHTNRTETVNTEKQSSPKETVSKGAIAKMDHKETPANPNDSKTNYSCVSETEASVCQQIPNITNHECVSETTKNISATPNNIVPIHYEIVDEVDKLDLNDSFPSEDELMIDEEPHETTAKLLQPNPIEISDTELRENCNSTLDSSSVSTLLNSSLYNEILTESFDTIANDLLQDDFLNAPAAAQAKSKRGRKRKSECWAELQPCKRSERLRAKQMILESTLNLSETQIDCTKWPNDRKNVLNAVQQKTEDKNGEVIAPETKSWQKSKILANGNSPKLGFFRERDVPDEEANRKTETINATNSQEPVAPETNRTYTICENNKNREEHENQKQICSQILNENIGSVNGCEEECLATNSLNDSFIYTDSPQSPPPIQSHNSDHPPEPCINIPVERPIQFVPQDNNPKLFDALMNSYKNGHQKQVLESISHKELKGKENILKQFTEHIMLYCNDEMELELYCTASSLINKLLSLSPDYNLIQKAVIGVAQNANSPNVNENDLPSTIQEMPPRHLSKCLQRLFTFLRIIVTRNSSFCQELNDKIENLLFNTKQMENLSLQATLNLTQLYLMASKVQEYLQVGKHPARFFISKCLYYYLQKSVLMVHEVLLWYPTVLPHREDKTYDRSDALISVIQQILMNTRYDMEKTDLRGKMLISKLRYEYHFEPFKPTPDEVVNVLVEKLKNSKFYNITLAFGLLCKRIGVLKTQNVVLGQHLMPLANEYYSLALKTHEYDKRIEVLLETISMIIKPLPIETETKKYFCEFARFLNGFERQIIQEAALCSILRLQRFNIEYCYSLLSHFQPTYNLNTHTQAMLKSFLYRRPLNFWKNLRSKNFINCN